MARRGPHIQLKLKFGTKEELGQKEPIFLVDREREEEESQKLPPKIYGVPLVGFVEPRTKVHCIDERYTWVPRKRDFAKDSRGNIS